MPKKLCKSEKEKKDSKKKGSSFSCEKCGHFSSKSDKLCKPEKK